MNTKIIFLISIITLAFSTASGQGVMGKKLQISYLSSQHPALFSNNNVSANNKGINFGHNLEFEFLHRKRSSLIFQYNRSGFYNNYLPATSKVHVNDFRFGIRRYTRGASPFGAYLELMGSYYTASVDNPMETATGVGGIFGTGIQWVIKDKFTIKTGYIMSLHFNMDEYYYYSFDLPSSVNWSYFFNTYLGIGMFIL